MLNGFLVALLNASYQYYFMPMAAGGEFDFDVANGVRLGVIFIFLVAAATSYYAYIFKIGLFGGDEVGNGFVLRWGRLEWRLIGYSLLLFIPMVLVFSVVGVGLVLSGAGAGILGSIAVLLFIAAIIYLHPRLFLFWPAIVDNQPNPFSAMFAVCRESTWFVWSIILLVILLSIPVLIVFGVADALLGFETPEQTQGVNFFFQLLLWQIIALPLWVWFSFLSCRFYLHLKNKQAKA